MLNAKHRPAWAFCAWHTPPALRANAQERPARPSRGPRLPGLGRSGEVTYGV